MFDYQKAKDEEKAQLLSKVVSLLFGSGHTDKYWILDSLTTALEKDLDQGDYDNEGEVERLLGMFNYLTIEFID